jgi:poly(3-hydroxybutyrate) depolymerase
MQRLIRYGLLVILVFCTILCSSLVYLSVKDYSARFVERKGTLATARLAAASGDSLAQKFWLTLTNTDGFNVECGMLAPRDSLRRSPAIVLLGGKTTGKNAIDYALGIENVIIVAVDYPFEPREQYSFIQFIADVPAIRQGLLDMVPSAMLVMDYLRTRTDVDTSKIILLGYSLGAPFVPCIAANERRFAAAAMVYGAGELRTLIRHNVNRYEGTLMSEFVGVLGGLLLAPLEPLRSIERIAPIPFIMINGTNDEKIPRENVETLFMKANESKKIVWIESAHVNPRNPELTTRIIQTLSKELAALGILDSSGISEKESR